MLLLNLWQRWDLDRKIFAALLEIGQHEEFIIEESCRFGPPIASACSGMLAYFTAVTLARLLKKPFSRKGGTSKYVMSTVAVGDDPSERLRSKVPNCVSNLEEGTEETKWDSLRMIM